MKTIMVATAFVVLQPTSLSPPSEGKVKTMLCLEGNSVVAFEHGALEYGEWNTRGAFGGNEYSERRLINEEQ